MMSCVPVGVKWTCLLALGSLALASGAPSRAAAPQDPAPGAQDVEPRATKAPATETPPTKPPPRRAIDGLGGVASTSTLTFPSQPDQLYQLEATYVFPQRARWRLAPLKPPAEGEASGQDQQTPRDRQARRLQFRSGAAAWTIAPGKTASEAYTAEEKRKTLLQFELRRVAMIWPAELEWKGPDNLRQTELPLLGRLEAELNPASGRPLSLRSTDLDGTARESLSEIQWSAATPSGRIWPSAWQLEVGGTIVWKERFSEVKGGQKYGDRFFLPPDQRQVFKTGVRGDNRVQHIEVPNFAVWRQDLSPEALKDWDVAIEEAREAIPHWVASFQDSPYKLDPRPAFLLGDDGLPTRLELHLEVLPEQLPTGWFVQGGFPAMRMILNGVKPLDGSNLRLLRARVPSGHRPGAAWVVVQLTKSGVGLTQIILPTRKNLR